MLQRSSSRKPAFTRRSSTYATAAATWDCGPQPLQLELPAPSEFREKLAAPVEKTVGSCVIVINIAGDNDDQE